MSNTTHTPGPWQLEIRPRTDKPWTCFSHVSSDKWGELAVVVTAMEDEEELSTEGVANARLIAAAPELLEALIGAQKAVISAYSQAHAEWQNADKRAERLDAQVQSWRETARAAIAKATGDGQ